MMKVIPGSVVAGLLVAAFMMKAAWQHNAQGEIHMDGAVDWGYWLLIGGSWFVPVSIITGALLSLILRPWRNEAK